MIIAASVFVATSLDGFIARSDGSIDWLVETNAVATSGEDYGYRDFMDTVDAIVLGRLTFEQVLTFGEWPYGEQRVVVLSGKGVGVSEAIRRTVSVTAEPPPKLAERLATEGVRHVYVDGGQAIQGFLAAGPISAITVTVVPVLLGSGRPLFGSLAADVALKHVSTRAYLNGFVQSKYRVAGRL